MTKYLIHIGIIKSLQSLVYFISCSLYLTIVSSIYILSRVVAGWVLIDSCPYAGPSVTGSSPLCWACFSFFGGLLLSYAAPDAAGALDYLADSVLVAFLSFWLRVRGWNWNAAAELRSLNFPPFFKWGDWLFLWLLILLLLLLLLL